MIWQTIKEWELEHDKEYPLWAYVWSYDGYGERWQASEWHDVQEYYEERRKQSKENYERNAMWDFQFEPMVLLPTDNFPKWGEGIRLKYDFEKESD
jgi:hypothetical protein